MVERRPDPAALLAAVQKEEAARRRGRLKIFFGMSAGVGKTYAMLEAARQRLTDGVDVVVGYVETHGRAETEALLSALPVIPRQKVEYRGITLEEMDLDAILARGPGLVLVDELAHTNAPGSRHPKRYQDVLELLDAGMDVYTTVNVQHLESRTDAVRQITGIQVRETIPDSVFEAADEVELIDLAPEELLKRLAEGKVYLGDQVAQATDNFFRKGNLTALREMSLRLTAERVDHQLSDYMAIKCIPGPWKSREHLMVAVNASPLSDKLVRWTRRMAYNLDAPWVAVQVETSHLLSAEQQDTLARTLSLAHELGAEVVTTSDEDIVRGLVRVAREHNITQIVVGKPLGNAFHQIVGRSLVSRLVRESGDIDVYVVTGDAAEGEGRAKARVAGGRPDVRRYLLSVGVIAAVTAVNWLLLPLLGYRAVAIVYLLVVSILGTFLGMGPVLLAAASSALLWDFLFIPPQMTLDVSDVGDALMLGMYFVVALVTGTLTARLRAQEIAGVRGERRATALYTLARELSAARTLDDVLKTVVEQMSRALDSDVAVLLPDSSRRLSPRPYPGDQQALSEKEVAVAAWAFQKGKMAGRFTDTLPSAEALYVPLRAPSAVMGVLRVGAHGNAAPSVDQQNLLATFASQAALALERMALDEKACQTSILAESERLYKTLLNSVSHELRTPLATITGAATSLVDPNVRGDPEATAALSKEIQEAGGRLNRVLENLLDMTRLESGQLRLHLEWCDVNDLISGALNRASADLAGHQVIRDVAANLPLVRMDLPLMEQALYNLLHNAAVHTPAGTRVRTTARVEGDQLLIAVGDRGPGLPPADLQRVFEKFYRAPGAPVGGVGLGLSVTKGLVEAHGGAITAENRANGGARFTIRLPLAEPPSMPGGDMP
jgi:two-component system, OmpR family, sensor histidine kinase KdpD